MRMKFHGDLLDLRPNSSSGLLNQLLCLAVTNLINGQVTLDTTRGSYADLMTDPGRPPDEGLKRVQRDIEYLVICTVIFL